MKNIVIVGGLHGDEPTGIQIAQHFGVHPQKNIRSIVAHAKAIKANKRFLETDLNRSFSPNIPVSLEEQLAEKIKKQLGAYDFLFDIHNTKGDYTTCAITVMEPNNLHKALAAHFGFQRIVIMPPSNSLIAQNPHKSISFEIALNERDYFTKEYLLEKFLSLDKKKVLKEKNEALIYYRFIQSIKSETVKRVGITPQEITNFTLLSQDQKQLLSLPLQKKYYPMFAKKSFNREVAFELLEEVVYNTSV